MTAPGNERFFIVSPGRTLAGCHHVLLHGSDAAADSWCAENGGMVLVAGNSLAELFGRYTLLHPLPTPSRVSADAPPGSELPE